MRGIRCIVFTVALISIAFFEVCCARRVETVFESRSLDVLLDTMLRHTKAETLKPQIHFRHPTINEELPLSSLVLVDKSSELTLRLENMEQEPMPTHVISELGKIFIFAVPRIETSDDKYFITVPEGTFYVLRDISGDRFLDEFHIFIDQFRGNVYVSTDVDVISQIDAGGYVFGGYGQEVEIDSKGYITKGFEEAELGLVLHPDVRRVDGYSGCATRYVKKNSPADRAGIMPGDVIIKVNGETLDSVDSLLRHIEEAKKTKTMTLIVYRDSKMLELTVTK